MKLILVGDSDISRWDMDYYPNLGQIETISAGRRGATLADTRERLMKKYLGETDQIIVFCAGENDIGSVPLWRSEEELTEILQATVNSGKLLFLGPKIEPVLDDAMRRHYIQANEAWERICDGFPHVYFLNCLLMFCKDADEPGSLLKAKADEGYFARDRFHLAEPGYRKLKVAIEEILRPLVEQMKS